MRIAFFASSLVSSYWNGAATYYRGIVAALAARGHEVMFYEPDAYGRQQNRDLDDPPWAEVVVWEPSEARARRLVRSAAGADVVVKASGVGVLDDVLEDAVAALDGPTRIFWDVDAPATLARVEQDDADPFRELIPSFDLVLTYGGGEPVVERYAGLGARHCIPVYNALDPETHHPAPPDDRFTGELGLLANRLPDREARVEEFFLRAASLAPRRSFLLAGSGWDGDCLPANVRLLGHLGTGDHNAFNSTPLAVLNVTRDSMAETGWSPATRVFEAAGAAACVITDAWDGIEVFLEPGVEVLVATDGADVARQLAQLTPGRAASIGAAARARVLREHTYAHRARQVEAILSPRLAGGGAVNAVFLGLSATSSWGNGHATNYRGLVGALRARGHHVVFLERDRPWYAQARDFDAPWIRLYDEVEELERRADDVRDADLVLVGSYVPDGCAVAEWVLKTARGVTAFWDLDTPVTAAKLGRGDLEYLSPALASRFDLYLSFTAGPLLERLGARRPTPFHCIADPSLYRPLGLAPRWDLGYLGTYSDDRQPTVDELLLAPARRAPGRSFAVAGPQYPASIDWPENVSRFDNLAPREHAAFYGAQRFTLNVTRRDMVEAGWSPSVRLFEAAACATPVISDWWEGLDAFFEPGREILVAESAADVERHLALAEEPRRAIGRRARRRVLERHTAKRRAVELEQHVRAVVREAVA